MRLQRPSVWIYNRSPRDIIVNELNLTLKSNQVVDLFRYRPDLDFHAFLRSERAGVLAEKYKTKELLRLTTQPPAPELPTPKYELSTKPLARRTKSGIGIQKKDRDYVAEMEAEFAPNLNEQQIIQLEKKQMLTKLDKARQGDDGEVFADDMFEDIDV